MVTSLGKDETMSNAVIKKRTRRPFLEGSLVVEMNDGSERQLTCTPFGGNVYHIASCECFGQVTTTPEDEFRANMRRVVSRSKYSRR